DVLVREPAVPGRAALRLDEPGALEEPDLGDGDVRELALELGEHLPDAHERPYGLRAHDPPSSPIHCPPGPRVRNTRRNLPICTSSPLASGASSMRSRLT